ncbi:MAG: sugar ABC transporter substrate-binding protein [Epulopiscium sp.]|nr:sugar ABC transporter substrate-binding protein [Candidatus Epulonipiscium sp.]
MKNKYYTTFVLILVLFILAITGFIFYRINRTLHRMEQNTEIIVPDQVPAYHFTMIYKDTDDSVWFSIKKGVEKASKEFNVAVEFNGSNSLSKDEMLKYFEIGIASKVDGIITYVWDEEKASSLIERAVNQGIPVITMGSDAKDSKRAAFVGVNTYHTGIQLGRMLIAATGGQGEVAVFDDAEQQEKVLVQNLMMLGIRDAIQQYPDIHISTIEYNNSDFLGIEDAIGHVLSGNSQYSTIVCTSEKETTVVAERLVDLNKVGYHIIGYGDSSELLRYIEKGVVFGTVTTNFEQMGYDTIRAMVDIKEKGRTSAYFTVDTSLITKNNVSEYIKAGEE